MTPEQKRRDGSGLIITVGAMLAIALQSLYRHDKVMLGVALAVGAFGLVMYVVRRRRPR